MSIVDLRIPMAIQDVSIVGAEPEEDEVQIPEALVERLRLEVQQQLADAQQQLQQDRKQITQAMNTLKTVVRELAAFRDEIEKSFQVQTLELGLAIAEKVLMQQIQERSYDVDPIVKEALSQLPYRGEIEIRLNPNDLQRCEMVGVVNDGDSTLHFVADPGISPAGCVVQSIEGRVESSVDVSLEQVEEALRQPDEE